MKTAIVVYSLSGNNRALAMHLQNRLSADLFVIDENKKKSGMAVFLDIAFDRTPSINAPFRVNGQYDHYVFIAPVWAGRIASPMKAFLKREKNGLHNNYSFATVCGGGSDGQLKRIEEKLYSLVGHAPVSCMELWVSKLFNKLDKKPAAIVSAYRINEQDIQSFRPEINHFVAEIKTMEHELIHQ